MSDFKFEIGTLVTISCGGYEAEGQVVQQRMVSKGPFQESVKSPYYRILLDSGEVSPILWPESLVTAMI